MNKLKSKKTVPPKKEKTVYKSISLMGLMGGGGPCAVDVKNGKILRVRPLHYDSKYEMEKINTFRYERNGKTFVPFMKSLPYSFSLAYKKRTYSPNRIKYPLQRIDWDPKGDRNPQNRGKSRYRRISWDVAASLIANEIKRIKKQYGTSAILAQGDGHAECKSVHAPHGCQTLLLSKIGEYTQQVRNPDSWEGWYWGAMHVWGGGDVGMANPSLNTAKDVTENSELLLFWGCDPETTPGGAGTQAATSLCYFWSQVGIKQVYICPDLNYGAAVHADKWIPVLPNTDAAFQLAIIYIWVTEGTYDKEYVKTHTVGMDKVEDYVLGKEDGIPKTPAWASEKCGVPEWTIKALASEFASKRTSIMHILGGSMIRGPYSTEPARLECIMLGMQGMGKPGVHQCTNVGALPRTSFSSKTSLHVHVLAAKAALEGRNDRILRPHLTTRNVLTKQHLPKPLVHDAILNSTVDYWGTGAIDAPREDQFVKYTYPLPKEEGGSEIHMIWTDTPCRTTCWNYGNKTIQALRSPKIECIVAQHPWLENDCLLADIILPSNTTMEVEDIMANTRGNIPCASITYQEQAIKPIGESKSDYEAVLEVAKKMGLYDEVSGGKTSEEWIKEVYNMNMVGFVDWDELREKGYYVFPTAKNWEDDPPGLRKFYEDPENNPLSTPTGKLEFYSESIAKNFPHDMERPPIPKWIEKGVMHDERISSDRSAAYPLILMSNHGRWRVHAQCDDITWTREIHTCKVLGPDGYKYEPLWLNPEEAEKRGIRNGDIVKIFNERGIVLAGAYVTERLIPGVAYIDHGARCDWIIPGKVDRGGAINLISPNAIISKHAGGQATSGYLVEVQKVSGREWEEWLSNYPDAFKREYDAAAGLLFDAWVEKD
ncbi:MAG: molybdopterin-dependent oxidoreductase [Deltaproteobacteria bacterium]|nr:molybdopterin-dependent oxidoreductase [Deltaproteobacteria bacterium]